MSARGCPGRRLPGGRPYLPRARALSDSLIAPQAFEMMESGLAKWRAGPRVGMDFRSVRQ